MKVDFGHISEWDMDNLIIRQIYGNPNFVSEVLLPSVGLKDDGWTVTSVAHSVWSELGESDIVAVLKKDNASLGLYIEDKVDASPQKAQAERYEKRAEKDMKNREVKETKILIAAPQDYLDQRSKVEKYKNQLSYERILEAIPENTVDWLMLKAVLDPEKRADKVVTAFWKAWDNYIKEHYPDIYAAPRSGPRASSASWAKFKSEKGTSIVFKTNQKCVDLQIDGYGDRFAEFSLKNQEQIDAGQLKVRYTGKSLSIREYVSLVDIHAPFEGQEAAVDEAIKAVIKLQGIAKKLNI